MDFWNRNRFEAVDIFYFAVVYFTSSAISDFLMNIISPYLIADSSFVFLINKLFTLIILLYVYIKRIKYISAIRYRIKINFQTLMIALIIILFAMSYLFVFDNILIILMKNIDRSSIITQYFDILLQNYFVALIFISIIAPVTEEILFRGVLFNALLSKYNPVKSIILTSMFFALFHGNIRQGISAFLWGIFICIVYYYKRSLPLIIYIHGVYNVISFVLGDLVSTTYITILFGIVIFIISCLIMKLIIPEYDIRKFFPNKLLKL